MKGSDAKRLYNKAEWIVDRSRHTVDGRDWHDFKQLARVMNEQLRDFRRDRWQDHPTYVELVLEKDAMSGSLTPIVNDYGLILSPVKGFDSTSNVHEIAGRLLDKRRAGKRIVILYCGDHDASGPVSARKRTGVKALSQGTTVFSRLPTPRKRASSLLTVLIRRRRRTLRRGERCLPTTTQGFRPRNHGLL